MSEIISDFNFFLNSTVRSFLSTDDLKLNSAVY
jgi:hypothetical protein